MKARPIPMSSPMIRALLDGRKTQTRRIVKPQPFKVDAGSAWLPPKPDATGCTFTPILCPYGKPGDLLAVKESAWMWCERRPNGTTKTGRQKWHYVPLQGAPIHYQAAASRKPEVSITHPETGNEWGWKLKVGRFMPRWASRLTLELTEVRVERLQDISYEDIKAEGVHITSDGREPPEHDIFGRDLARVQFSRLWESINGPASWAANPWCWAISFRVHHKNVDALLAERSKP